MKRSYFPAFTGIRALAAFLILMHHTLKGRFENEVFNSIIRELNVGVNMFFVLSGFLIWYTYSINFSLSKAWLRAYFIKRFARIFPLYFILTTITIILVSITQNQTIAQFITTYILNISLLRGFSSTYLYSGIPQGWTLSVEELFYISAPIILYLNLIRKISLKILGLGIFIIGILLFLIFREIDVLGFFDNLKYLLITTYFGRFAEFFAGIMLAKMVVSVPIRKFTFPYLTISSAILLAVSVGIILPSFQTSTYQYSIQTPMGYIYGVYVFPIFVAALYLGLITESSRFKDLLETGVLSILGKSSYALYLIHDGVIASILLSMVGHHKIIFIILVYIISIVLWKYFESPVNRKIRNLI